MKDRSCKYYPCHEKSKLHDCSYCYCPMYSCGNSKTGGKWVKTKHYGKWVWDCSDCTIVHSESFHWEVKNAFDKFINKLLKKQKEAV